MLIILHENIFFIFSPSKERTRDYSLGRFNGLERSQGLQQNVRPWRVNIASPPKHVLIICALEGGDGEEQTMALILPSFSPFASPLISFTRFHIAQSGLELAT